MVENEDLEGSDAAIVLLDETGGWWRRLLLSLVETKMIELDQIDRQAAASLDGYLVRKDLVRTFSRQFPVPTYVVEFLLGRYCASIDPDEIEEGLEIVQRQLADRTVKAGEEELFKSRARESGEVKIIDLITARLDAKTDSYLVTLPSLQLKDARIEAELVSKHERMLTGGFYAEITLDYDSIIAQEKSGRPLVFGNSGKFSSQSETFLIPWRKPGSTSARRNGSAFCSDQSVSKQVNCPNVRRMRCCCAWCLCRA